MTLESERFIAERFTNGSLFEDKYRIDGIIGVGNFAHVIKARHEAMDRDVALKVLKPEMKESNPDLSERFVNEVKIVSRLKHPNSVTIFDFGHTDDGLDYMVLEYFPGRSLDEILDATGYMEVDRVAHIAFQILGALAEAHKQRIIHRDLKPSNVMLADIHGEVDVVRVLDFGVAKLVGQDDRLDKADTLTRRRSTRFIGTPIYMSPEQVLGQDVVPASDFYSLGLILYEMFTGDPPLKAKNVAAVARLHIDEEPLPLELIHRLPEKIQRLIRVATQRYPSDRFQNATEFAQMLTAATGMDSELSEVEEVTSLEAPSESTRDFFINQPKSIEVEGEFEAESTNTTRRRSASGSSDRRRSRPREKKEGLQLDIDRVRKVENLRRVQEQPAVRQHDTTPWITTFSIGGLGLVSFFLATYLAGCFATPTSGATRFVVSFIPVVAAGLWTGFTQLGVPTSGSFTDKWFLPTSLHMFYVLCILVVAAFLIFPEHATNATNGSATWYTGQTSGTLTDIGNQLGTLFTKVFQLGDDLTPW